MGRHPHLGSLANTEDRQSLITTGCRINFAHDPYLRIRGAIAQAHHTLRPQPTIVGWGLSIDVSRAIAAGTAPHNDQRFRASS